MSLTHSSSNHRLDLSPFIDTNSNTIFSVSSATPIANVYQPLDIVALLEPSSSDISVNNESSVGNLTNTLPTTTLNNVPPSCLWAALFQENIISSLLNTFESFSKLFPNDNQSSSSSRYNHLSPLLATATD